RPRRVLEPAARVRIRWRRARLDRRRLPRLRLGPARRRYPPRRAGALAVVGDADDERPPDARGEGGFRAPPGVLRRHGLGFRDVGPHPAHAPRTLGRELRMARPVRHRLVQRPCRGHDDNPHDPAGARASQAADTPRLLDGCLPGDRRLTAIGSPFLTVIIALAIPFLFAILYTLFLYLVENVFVRGGRTERGRAGSG